MNKTTKTVAAKKPSKEKKDPYWLIYLSAIISGWLLLAYSFGVTAFQKLPARLGVALVFSALALLIGRGKPAGYVAAAVIWLTVIMTLFY